jgi:TIR domain
MKIFLSWSGDSSRLVAEALYDWLPRVIQAIKPFLSTDIEKGAKWSNELDNALEGTNFGIVCLTPDNLKSTWIHYEVGALSKQTEDSLIWTFLLQIKPTDVKQPLGKFQHTLAQKKDVLKLLRSINSKLAEPLKDPLLEESFSDLWQRLEKKLEEAAAAIEIKSEAEEGGLVASEGIRNESDKLDEILEMLRNQRRQRDRETPSLFINRKNETAAEELFTEFKISFKKNKTHLDMDRAKIEDTLLGYFPINSFCMVGKS